MANNCKTCHCSKCLSNTVIHQCFCKKDNNQCFPLTPLTPYPDEVITTLIDRLMQLVQLVYTGKVPPSTPLLSCESLCISTSITKIAPCKENICRTPLCPSKTSNTKLNSKTSFTSQSSNKAVDTILPPVSTKKKTITVSNTINNQKMSNKNGTATQRGLLKRSYSVCSLACKKMKSMFSNSSGCNNENARWLWTKERKDGHKCHVYDVFKNSTISSHPKQFDNPSAARIIFIILPTGIIMPFETVNDAKNSKILGGKNY